MELLEGQTLALMMARRPPFDLKNLLAAGIRIADARTDLFSLGTVARPTDGSRSFSRWQNATVPSTRKEVLSNRPTYPVPGPGTEQPPTLRPPAGRTL